MPVDEKVRNTLDLLAKSVGRRYGELSDKEDATLPKHIEVQVRHVLGQAVVLSQEIAALEFEQIARMYAWQGETNEGIKRMCDALVEQAQAMRRLAKEATTPEA